MSFSTISWYFSGIAFAFVIPINKTKEMNLRALVILFSFSFFGPLTGNETGHKIELLTQTGNYSDELIVE